VDIILAAGKKIGPYHKKWMDGCPRNRHASHCESEIPSAVHRYLAIVRRCIIRFIQRELSTTAHASPRYQIKGDLFHHQSIISESRFESYLISRRMEIWFNKNKCLMISSCIVKMVSFLCCIELNWNMITQREIISKLKRNKTYLRLDRRRCKTRIPVRVSWTGWYKIFKKNVIQWLDLADFN
jgi:hypothetical protein